MMKLPALSKLSLEQIAGQLFMPAVHIDCLNRKSPTLQKNLRRLRRYQPNGFIIFGGQADTAADWINLFQQHSPIPLLFGADLERGTGGIFKGGTIFPQAMTLGAADDEALARQMATVIAKEARAMGIQVLFAPVLDLADHPENPIINIRAFHEKPETVARLGAAFIEAAQLEGVACVGKHFPGHGSTGADSHLTLPQLTRNLQQLSRRDLKPFKQAIESGVKGIMTGHLLSADATEPVGFSDRFVKDYLRKKLNFGGVIFTDALNMKAVSGQIPPAEQIRLGLAAESDVFLMPPNWPLYFQLTCRIISGDRQLKRKALQSVERIFELKKWLSKNKAFSGNRGKTHKFCQLPAHVGLSLQIAEKGIICLRNNGVLPLNLRSVDSVAHFIFTDFPVQGEPLTDLNRHGREFFETFSAKVNPAPEALLSTNARLTVISIYHRTFGGHQSRIDSNKLKECLNTAVKKKTPVIVLIFGNPYPVGSYPEIFGADAVLFSPGYTAPNQIAAFKALLSAIPVNGEMPVSLRVNGKKVGAVSVPAASPGLKPAEKSPPLPDTLAAILNDGIVEGVFPGAVLLVAHRGEVIWEEACGTFAGNQSPHSRAVCADTVYDLASLTKVLATTPAVLQLADKGILNLQMRLGEIYGLPPSHPLGEITITDLLAHQAGLPAWLPLYEKVNGQREVVDFILNLTPEYPPRTQALYSDLGFILLGDIIQLFSGQPLDDYCRDAIFHPMGLTGLHFRPVASAAGRVAGISGKMIPPTGNRPVPGEAGGVVNDLNCRFMGGIAGHSGLFGTARDVANMAWLFLNNGIWGAKRILKPQTTLQSTRPVNPVVSARGLGWDTPTAPSSSGKYFSRSSFGHLAFTGPSLWVDREKELIVAFLCNRTWKDEQNEKIRQFRPQLHDAVLNALRLA